MKRREEDSHHEQSHRGPENQSDQIRGTIHYETTETRPRVHIHSTIHLQCRPEDLCQIQCRASKTSTIHYDHRVAAPDWACQIMAIGTYTHRDSALAIRCTAVEWGRGSDDQAEAACILRLMIRCLQGRVREDKGMIHEYRQEADTILSGRAWVVIRVALVWVADRLEEDHLILSAASEMETSYR